MRRDPPVRADLHNPLSIACGFYHRLSFENCMAYGLFDINIGPRFAGGDCNQGVPVVGRGVYHDIRFDLVEKLAVILVFSGLSPVSFSISSAGRVEDIFIHIAHRDDFTFAAS